MLTIPLRALRLVMFIVVFTSVLVVLLLLFPLTALNPLLRMMSFNEQLLPVNLLLRHLMRFALLVGGIRLHVTDKSGTEGKPCIYMYNHTSNLDPLILGSVTSCKFIYKKELGHVPLFGWLLFLYNHVSIDRKNKDKAIESLNRAVRSVVRKHQSIAIAPEGTRSKSGELLEFKKGPFHLALQSKAPIVPVIIRGAHSLLPPKSILIRGGVVSVSLLPQSPPPADEELVEAKLTETRKIFSGSLDEQSMKDERPSELSLSIPAILVLAALFRIVVL